MTSVKEFETEDYVFTITNYRDLGIKFTTGKIEDTIVTFKNRNQIIIIGDYLKYNWNVSWVDIELAYQSCAYYFDNKKLFETTRDGLHSLFKIDDLDIKCNNKPDLLKKIKLLVLAFLLKNKEQYEYEK
jgi:hypothetical protein